MRVTNESPIPAGPMTLTALGELVGLSQPHMSRLLQEGLIVAPAAEKGRRRAVPAAEVVRVVRVVGLARSLGIAPAVLFRFFGEGRAALLPDGRVALGAPIGEAAA